jgi:hypothetical protein
MKESVKLDSELVQSVKKHIKLTGQTISGFFEVSAKGSLSGGIIGMLKEDPEVFEGWKANIAMAIKDEFSRYRKKHDKRTLSYQDIHLIANKAADDFLKLLIK